MSANSIIAEVHSENAHINWALFKPSMNTLDVLEYGHGGVDAVRQHLISRNNEVVYGLMRFTFQFVNGSQISKWLFFVWYEASDFDPSFPSKICTYCLYLNFRILFQ